MKIQLDKPREFSFTMYALRVFKQDTGISLLKGVKDFDEDTIINLTYAGLKGADREMELSVDDVAFHMDFSAFKDVMDQLGHDMTKLTGKEEKK